MNKNIWSLGLLRNGKVYANKVLASQALTQSATNDGVAKLARYLDVVDGVTVIKTLVGFYANAAEMDDNGGGSSYYTLLDIDGIDSDIQELQQAIDDINDIIGDGIANKTLTEAINEINAKIGEGFDAGFTVADAIAALKDELEDELTISLDVAGVPTSGYLKTYILSQGTGSGKTEIGRIDIPKDMVVSGASVVHGTWDGDVFTPDPAGKDLAIKIDFANADTIYINVKDLVDIYTAGNGITVENNVISIKRDPISENFLLVDENGIKVVGVQAAIDRAVSDSHVEASDGISIAANKVKAVAAKFSAPGINNPITVEADGIKLSKALDCGYWDDNDTVIANTAADVQAIANPSDTDLFINSDAALNALGEKKTFNNLEVANVDANEEVYLYANESVVVDNMEVTGTKGSTNGKILYSAPTIEISNLSIANGSTAYNVFEGDQTNQNLKVLNASNITVDNPALTHNVFNVYKPKDNCVINIKDGVFNLTVDNSNVLRVSNTANATSVTVNFENIEWTYENGLSFNNWGWAGLVIYQPYSTDAGYHADYSKMATWTFNFKNCKYNGVKVTANNFGEHNQVMYMYNINGDGQIIAPDASFKLNFE